MFNRFPCLHDFVGYGAQQPRFVFIGIEEHGASDGSELNFETRCSQFELSFFDKNEASQLLASVFRDHGQIALAEGYERAIKPDCVRVWRFCAMIAAAVRTPSNWETNWPSEYEKLGSRSGDTLLTWLFPVPKPGTKYWPRTYQEWFGSISYNKYYTSTWPLRRKLLQEAVLKELPFGSVVFCYGKCFWGNFSDLLQLQDWKDLIPGRAQSAITPRGLSVVRAGFPFGRDSKSRVTEEHVLKIAGALSL